MRIGLVDVDGKGNGFPNLALMKIAAYHKAQGDEVEWAQEFMIERTCEWLLNNAHLYVYATTKEKRALLFDNFRKAMEE